MSSSATGRRAGGEDILWTSRSLFQFGTLQLNCLRILIVYLHKDPPYQRKATDFLFEIRICRGEGRIQ